MTMKAAHFIDVGPSLAGHLHLHFSVIHSFCNAVCLAIEANPDSPIVIFPNDASASSLSNAILLYGAYLILCKGQTLDAVVDALRNSVEAGQHLVLFPRSCDRSILDALSAIERALALDWLAPPNTAEEPALDIGKATHYAHPANGGLQTVVPDRLRFFPSPVSLSAGQAWADASPADASPRRRFSAAFLAELLADFGVSAVVCLGLTRSSDLAAFRGCGLDVHDLDLDRQRLALLGAMDRLVSLAHAAPGAVAVCSWEGDDGSLAGRESIQTLGAAWLMAEGGFGTEAAEAWVGMACSAAAGSVLEE